MPTSVPVRPVRMNAEQNVADVGCDTEVTGRGEREAAAEGGTVDCGDDDLGRVVDVLGEVRQKGLGGDAGVAVAVLADLGRRAVVAQVEACAEAATGTGQHDDPAVRVRRHRVERVVELADHRIVQRVQLVGSVQSKRGDVLGGLLDQDGLAHATRSIQSVVGAMV